MFPQTGGGLLKYGPPNGPWIDAGDTANFTSTSRRDAIALARSSLIWAPWQNKAWIPNGSRGLIGADEAGRALRMVWSSKLNPVEALRQIEDYSPDVPVELIAAFLVASTQEVVRQAPRVIATLAFNQPEPGASRLNGAQIDTIARRWMADLEHSFPAQLSKVDWARFLLRSSAMLWEPGTRNAIITDQINDETGSLLATLASAHLMTQRAPAISVAGFNLPVDEAALMSAWIQCIEWEIGEAPANAIRFTTSGRIRHPLPNAMTNWPDSDLVAPDAATANGLYAALIRDAEQNAVYVPTGSFVLELPRDHPLQKIGAHELRVWADPDQLWAGLQMTDRSASVHWTPESGIINVLIPDEAQAWLNITLAALWRDLHVAGERVVPRRDRPATPATPPTSSPKPQHASSHLVLPRARFVMQGERREWSTPAERELIHRRRHGVRGHLRTLHTGWQAGAYAEATAAEFGLVLPDGKTFVRPHIRGEGEETTRETVVVARGLATVMTLL